MTSFLDACFHYRHHYKVVLTAQSSLALFPRPASSSIAPGNSSRLHLLIVQHKHVHMTGSTIECNLWVLSCFSNSDPIACLVRLTWMVCEILFDRMLHLVFVQDCTPWFSSIFSSNRFPSVYVVHQYSSTDIAIVWKKPRFISDCFDRPDL